MSDQTAQIAAAPTNVLHVTRGAGPFAQGKPPTTYRAKRAGRAVVTSSRRTRIGAAEAVKAKATRRVGNTNFMMDVGRM